MELRELTASDRGAQARLMAEAFGRGRREATPEEKQLLEEVDASLSLGIFDGARLVASATIHDIPITWGAFDTRMGGVAGVACTADQRGRGHVGKLLAESLQRMRESGQYLSGLYPFAWAFYRRHGWDWVGEKRSYTVPTSEVRSYGEGWYLQSLEGPESLDRLRPVYDAFVRRYRGATTRTGANPDFWGSALSHRENRTTYVQAYTNPDTGVIEGYLTFRYPAEGETGRIDEFVANTPAAYRALLSVIHYYGTQVRKVEFDAPADDPLLLHGMHWDIETKVRPLFMGRVVDGAAAMAALRPETALSGRVVLRLEDGQCDWNRGTFEIQASDGRVTVAPSDALPGVEIDIQTLTQAYWGYPSLDRLRAAGRVTVTDEAQYQVLSQLLPPAVSWIQDFF